VRHAPGRIVHALKSHTGPVSALVLLPDERGFISGSWDKTVKVSGFL
jgi:transcriptional activator SPT8